MKKTISADINLDSNIYIPIATVKQLDDVTLVLAINNSNGVAAPLDGQTISMYVKRANNTVVEQTDGISVTTNKVTINCKNSCFSVQGNTELELKLVDTDGTISTSTFYITTKQSLSSKETIEATNDIAILKQVELQENERQTSENVRKSNELVRQNTEKGRQANEEYRQNNEETRRSAEAERQINESKRETAYAEIEEARKDYRGNTHKSLEDRLNADQDEIYNRFNNATLLPYSDKYITAENSYKGRTSDLVLNGRTLQNLIQLGNAQGIISDRGYAYKVNIHPIKYINKTVTLINLHDKIISYQVKKTGTQMIENFLNPYEKKVITLASDECLDSVAVLKTNGWTDENKNELKGFVLEGDWTNKPVPQYFEGIKSVCGTGETLQVKSCGKNLFPSNGVFKRTIDGTDWFINHKTYSFKDENGEILKPFSVLPSTSIKIIRKFIGSNRIIVAFFDKNMGIIPHTSYNISNGFRPNESYNGWWINADDIPHITIPYNAYYMTIGTVGITTFSEICVEITSDTAASYEPYTEDKTDLLKDLNLRGLDSNIRDILDSKGVLSRNVGKIVIDENKKIFVDIGGSSADCLLFFITDSSIKNISEYYSSLICNNFKNVYVYGNGNNFEGFFQGGANNRLWFKISKSKLTGYNDSLSNEQKINLVKTWLQANPTIAYYQLAEPLIEQIEGMKELSTYDKVTHIFQEGSLIEGDIECKVPSNVQATIAALKLENKALAVENTSLKTESKSTQLNSIENALDQDYRLTVLENNIGR